MPPQKKIKKDENGSQENGDMAPDVISELVEEHLNSLDAFDDMDSFLDVKRGKTVHWSVSWADLMMTMFILFVVMYIYQTAHRELIVGTGKENVTDVGPNKTLDTGTGGINKLKEARAGTIYELYDLSKRAFKNEFLRKSVSVDLVSDEAVKVILTGDLLFDTGKADLKYRAKFALTEIAEIIRDTEYVVNVVGHTDNVPNHSENFPSNWELSAYRACAVTRFLITEMEIPENRFYISAHSHLQPLRPNTSYKNRRGNRRVEIILTRERPYGVPRSSSDQIRAAYSD